MTDVTIDHDQQVFDSEGIDRGYVYESSAQPGKWFFQGGYGVTSVNSTAQSYYDSAEDAARALVAWGDAGVALIDKDLK